jgi:hypothetical protein
MEWRAPSKDEEAGLEAAGACECAESGKTMIRIERDAANVLTA